ncbi:unnamed protein product [Staurois parvus]|uniref:Uncharacterized protein n=1 Tax=Staurois parvus TaxID=386267 RepID=A0ABN9EML6_9NEOB|nr:unnamed protein product [Staurois parvus]
MGGHTAPYEKMEPTSSVRRPERWHIGRVWRWRTAAMGGRTGTHGHTLDLAASMRRRYRAHDRLRPGSSSGREAVGAHGAGWRWGAAAMEANSPPLKKREPTSRGNPKGAHGKCGWRQHNGTDRDPNKTLGPAAA